MNSTSFLDLWPILCIVRSEKPWPATTNQISSLWSTSECFQEIPVPENRTWIDNLNTSSWHWGSMLLNRGGIEAFLPITYKHQNLSQFIYNFANVLGQTQVQVEDRTHLCAAGGPPASSGGGRGPRPPAEAPLLAAAVRQRLGLQGFEGHGAHGVAGHWARTNRYCYGDARGGSLECLKEGMEQGKAGGRGARVWLTGAGSERGGEEGMRRMYDDY